MNSKQLFAVLCICLQLGVILAEVREKHKYSSVQKTQLARKKRVVVAIPIILAIVGIVLSSAGTGVTIWQAVENQRDRHGKREAETPDPLVKCYPRNVTFDPEADDAIAESWKKASDGQQVHKMPLNIRAGDVFSEGTYMILFTEEDSAGKVESCKFVFTIKNSGPVDFPHFLQMMAKKIEHMHFDDDMLEAFQELDKHGNAVMSTADTRFILSDLGHPEEEVEEMMENADLDQDGHISYDEFSAMMMEE